MSTENNNNDNIEQIYTGEETEYQESNNEIPLPPPPPPPQPQSSGFGFGTPGFSPTFPIPPTRAAGSFSFGGRPLTGGGFSIPSTTAASFGSFGGLQPTGMGGCGFMGGRVERHPETGQPIPMGCNLMPPQGVCGGIRNNHSGSSQNNPLPFGQRPNEETILNAQQSKKKHIDDLYKKLASARSQIQALNKVIDEIYETLPEIN